MITFNELFQQAGTPPQAEKRPKVLEHFNDKRIDEYYWLRDKESPEVIELLNQENLYTQRVTSPLEELEEELFLEMKSRIKETDLSVPVQKGNYLYFLKTEEGLQYPIHLRKGIGSETEEVLLDENDEAEGHDFFALGGLSVSPDENLIAYLTDTNGSEVYKLTVREIGDSSATKAQIEDVYYGIAWSLDSRVVFYTKTDEQMRPYQVWRINLDSGESQLVFEELDEGFYLGIGTTKDDQYIVIETESKTTSQSHLIDAKDPFHKPIAFSDRVKDLEYSVEHHSGTFFVVTNRDNPDFTLMFVDHGVNDHKQWSPFIPMEQGVRLLGIEVFSNYLALLERCQAVTRLRIVELGTHEIYEVSKAEEVSVIHIGDNEEFNSKVLRYEYSSMITPRSVYDIDLETKDTQLLKQSEVLGEFHSQNYKTFRLWAQARDGTQIPISVVARADLQPSSGGHPTLIYGYGSYEHSIDPGFSTLRLSLLDRGVIFAIAHVRGGGEMGRGWYLKGKLSNKMNTFTDFIDCTKTLIDLNWADRNRIAARGGSAGGMLMGAVANLAPDLYRAIVAEVPFVDCLTTILDPSLPLTTFEWEEWGNPVTDESIYSLMKTYSPYENISECKYPAMLITAGLNDPRVSYWEPAKWVQRLRDKTVDPKIILKTEMGAGHQGPSGRYHAWRDEAFVYAFILRALEAA